MFSSARFVGEEKGMSDEKKVSVTELDMDDLDAVAGGKVDVDHDVDNGCTNTYCDGANCVVGCSATVE